MVNERLEAQMAEMDKQNEYQLESEGPQYYLR